MKDYIDQKISLSSVLEISTETITDISLDSLEKLPWHFLKKLMILNSTARNTEISQFPQFSNVSSYKTTVSFDDIFDKTNDDSTLSVNPLDLITAILLCSDCFLQQQLMVKMSLRQFPLPLLLPDCRTNRCTLLVWALRDIVKKWRPHSMESSKGVREENLVVTKMPAISFIRLGNCKLSKSKILNEVFGNREQQQNFFIHHNLQCGDIRTISNGLVEICWSLPCGKTYLDIFPDPLAIINLRGDASSYLTQFQFLKTISTAVFIFVDSIDENQFELLSTIQSSEGQYYFILSSQVSKQHATLEQLRKLAPCLKLDERHVLVKSDKINKADFVQRIRGTIKDILASSSSRISVEEMATKTNELEINVDECDEHCLIAQKIAGDITAEIQDVAEYKERVLPLQGDLLKELAQLEKELHRMKNQGTQNTEIYKSKVKAEILKKQQKQNQYKPSSSTRSFINAIQHVSSEHRHYFLKWMKFRLDMKARQNLSNLREKYKSYCKDSSGHCKELVQLDKKIGLEHFMREIGQIYEAERLLVDGGKLAKTQKQYGYLPSVAAELMLEGNPIELIDGDASHLPIRWVTDVLTELKNKMGSNSKIHVITVLGVQSTGKSTLLNTMFGLQFAVSSGRCTRGAFMLLIKVKEDLRETLGCDFLMVIDTEGLKSPQLAKLEDSYEHDNELATLVVGLSDITLVNLAMENSTEMKDILQIVVHAFLRMHKFGKKPNCLFVHQNVGDVSAHDQKIRDRKLRLEELDEMTKVAAKMEKQSTRSKFSDQMEYDAEKDNSYISGLWYDVPPMAPVNTGYSEKVYEAKKYLIDILKQKKHKSMDILDFVQLMQSLWNAVKHETFIFNFRNSLVADAYDHLCSNYSSWESSFHRNIHFWLLEAETKICNHSSVEVNNLSRELDTNVQEKLQSEEVIILRNLESYFDSKVENVYLVEKYRDDFITRACILKRELQQHAFIKIREALGIKKGTEKYDKIQAQYTERIEEEVTHLLQECRKSRCQLDSEQLNEKFEKMWKKTLTELQFDKIEKQDVKHKVFMQLKLNMQNKGSGVKKRLAAFLKLDCVGQKSFTVEKDHIDLKLSENPLKAFNEYWNSDISVELSHQSDSLIQACNEYISEKANTPNLDYDDTYTRELLQKLDERLKQPEFQKLRTTPLNECELKLHICELAARAFQRMHDKFIQDHDPLQRLEEKKQNYLSTFTDTYNKKDQCQKKAKELCDLCLKPALQDYVHKHLGLEIIENFQNSDNYTQYHTRKYFQFALLKELLEEGVFEDYLKHISNYEEFVKDWIFTKVVSYCTEKVKMADMEKDCLSKIMKKVKSTVEVAKEVKVPGKVSEFFDTFFDILKYDIVVSKESLGMSLFQNEENIRQFADNILHYIDKMEEELMSQFKENGSVAEKLSSLPFKPQNELFAKVFGCGKQCPFCKVPCEAGGGGHTEHWAEIHRPRGLL
uniref:VLIG-type G domain-containing protein n=1 Tax=Latimeria chalumnae TaxID=7897 RepID=H3AFV1_LATCH